MSLTARFLLGFTLVACVGLFVLFSQLIQRVERQYMEATEEPLVDAANFLAELLAAKAATGTISTQEIESALKAAQKRRLSARIYNHTKEKVDLEVYVTDADARVLFDSSGKEPVGSASRKRDITLTLAGQYGARSTRADPKDPNSIIMYVAAPILQDGRVIGVVSLAKPQRGVLAFVWETERWLKWAIGSTIFLMLLGIYLAARWATRPLDDLTQHALAISRGERSNSPHMPGVQMKTLARALEDMRDALEGREYVESYVQSLTHELKSPVAAILGASEILQDPGVPAEKQVRFLSNIRSEAGRLRDLLERLLHLAALEKQKTLVKREPADLRLIIQRAWVHHAMLAAAKNLRCEHELAPDLIVEGDPWLIELAIGNLIQNAIDFSPTEGLLRIKSYPFEQRAIIEIEDQGPGIPDYARQRVFDRFYSLPRPDTGKKSSGLGLCFVKEAATLHSGSIELLPQENAPGTKAVFMLPGPLLKAPA